MTFSLSKEKEQSNEMYSRLRRGSCRRSWTSSCATSCRAGGCTRNRRGSPPAARTPGPIRGEQEGHVTVSPPIRTHGELVQQLVVLALGLHHPVHEVGHGRGAHPLPAPIGGQYRVMTANHSSVLGHCSQSQLSIKSQLSALWTLASGHA